MTARRRLLRAAFQLLAPAGLAATGSTQARSGSPLRLSPVDQYGIARTASHGNPIIDYVSGRSGVPVELVFACSMYAAFAQLPAGTAFVLSGGSEYGACRSFHETASVHLR